VKPTVIYIHTSKRILSESDCELAINDEFLNQCTPYVEKSDYDKLKVENKELKKVNAESFDHYCLQSEKIADLQAKLEQANDRGDSISRHWSTSISSSIRRFVLLTELRKEIKELSENPNEKYPDDLEGWAKPLLIKLDAGLREIE